jgi:hypothetical protein
MAMVRLEGWCLPSADTLSLDEKPATFFLNPHSIVSSRPIIIGDMAGYLLLDVTAMAYFITSSEAEMSTLSQLVT